MDAAHGRQRRDLDGRGSAPDRLAGRASPTAIRPYRDLGFSTVIVRMPAPYDRQTIERIGEVAAALDAMRVVELAGGVGGAKLAEGLAAHLGDRT